MGSPCELRLYENNKSSAQQVAENTIDELNRFRKKIHSLQG